MFAKNTVVTGEYYGHPFKGVVVDRRPHTMNSEVVYFVSLDTPMDVFGDVRSTLAVITGAPDTHIREDQ